MAFFDRLDIYRIFRKSKRYKVDLILQCSEIGGDKIFSGRMLDISGTGCLAIFKDLAILHDQMLLTFSLPFDDGVCEVELTVEHIWVSGQVGRYFHGFRFMNF